MNATDDWYDVSRVVDGTYGIDECDKYGMYLVEGSSRAVLLDTGVGVGALRGLVDDLVETPVTVVLTHTHWDHIGAASQFDEVVVSPVELPGDGRISVDSISDEFAHRPREFARQWLADDNAFPDDVDPDEYTVEAFEAAPAPMADGLPLGDRTLEFHHLPGHSPGHLGVLDPETRVLYGGDIVHVDHGLYVLFEGSSLDAYLESVATLRDWRDDGRFDVLVTSHNEPLAGSELSLLDDLLDGLHEIADGEREYEVVETTWGRAHSYRVGTSNVLTKPTV
ncbi:MBL fold metallo-hydrolase [Halomarina ordinaria]|uniref:MBL fold metallo-hydrolase n=1 Tax=Halomarina ordinaria TaxID=3033939 RepID=A0ABD5UB70_9EURY|nr:MBL fold metallo-hydrolase [Halomarina sp. PSRA2]